MITLPLPAWLAVYAAPLGEPLADSTRHDAAMWRALMEPDHGDGRTEERLRITAQRAAEDWLAERKAR